MNQFKLTREMKRGLAREIKKKIKDNDYFEIAIMYDIKTEGFFLIPTGEIEIMKHMGHIFYNTFIYYKADYKKEITLTEIENQVFKN
nr:MAG TPA: hypothetical protein [Caudoviricetes sp.]